MVAVEQPRADCGHVVPITQQCGRCLRWCCPECYAPWTALACGACRAEAQAARAPETRTTPTTTTQTGTTETRAKAADYVVPSIELVVEPAKGAGCQTRSRPRRGAGAHRHKDREPSDVRALAARVADLERLLQELRPGH